MSFWDILIFAIVLFQFIALGVLGMMLLRLYKGPVTGVIRRSMKLVRTGSRLGKTGVTILSRNLGKGQELVEEVKGVAQGVKYGTRTDFGDAISYRSLFALWLSFRGALGSVMGAWVFLSGLGKKKEMSPPAPSGMPSKSGRLPRRSLADRMGLVPPIAHPLGRFVNYGRIAWEVRNELKRRGIRPF